MPGKTQKYLLETFLELHAKDVVLIRPSDGGDYIENCSPAHKDVINSTNIYFICKKPRLRFIENSLLYDHEHLGIGIELTTKDKIKREFFILSNYHQIFPTAVGFSIHKEKKSKLVINWSKGNPSDIPIEMMINYFYLANNNTFNNFLESDVFDYEILYIGQSIGKEGQSNAYKRIMKHEKLQQILSDLVENEPYNEIFTILFSIDSPYFFGTMDGKFCNDQSKNNVDSLKNFINNDRLSKKEIISITEACLIRYFCPPYNTFLKNKFPNGDEKLLQKCRKYDVNSVLVVINTNISMNNCMMKVNLFSQKIDRNFDHRAKIQLHKDDNRINFENISSEVV